MRQSLVLGALAASLVVALPGGARADEEAEALSRGEVLFRAHCAACHGADGHGDGPMAADLRTRPADLTMLRDEAGAFPAERARRFIDGRDLVGPHGSREMPVWGVTFLERDRPGDQESEVAGRIDDLVRYLRSIQRDPSRD